MHQLDNIDKKIIELLSQNARISINQLSKQVFMTSPAVASRMEKLEKLGIITGYQASLNLDKLGFPITAFIELTMEPERRGEFIKFIADKKNILECHHVSGVYSMLLKVCFSTTTALDAFVGSLQTFGRTQTQIVFSTIVSNNSIGSE